MKFLLIQLNKPLKSACQLILIQVTNTIVTNFAQCSLYLQNLYQNSKAPEQKYLNNYLLNAKGKSMNNIYLTFGKYLLIFIHYYVILPC